VRFVFFLSVFGFVFDFDFAFAFDFDSPAATPGIAGRVAGRPGCAAPVLPVRAGSGC
jgi:hypothetical protein